MSHFMSQIPSNLLVTGEGPREGVNAIHTVGVTKKLPNGSYRVTPLTEVNKTLEAAHRVLVKRTADPIGRAAFTLPDRFLRPSTEALVDLLASTSKNNFPPELAAGLSPRMAADWFGVQPCVIEAVRGGDRGAKRSKGTGGAPTKLAVYSLRVYGTSEKDHYVSAIKDVPIATPLTMVWGRKTDGGPVQVAILPTSIAVDQDLSYVDRTGLVNSMLTQHLGQVWGIQQAGVDDIPTYTANTPSIVHPGVYLG